MITFYIVFSFIAGIAGFIYITKHPLESCRTLPDRIGFGIFVGALWVLLVILEIWSYIGNKK